LETDYIIWKHNKSKSFYYKYIYKKLC